MKRTRQPEEPKKPHFNWQEHKDFVQWWMEHEHAGYAVKDGKTWWTISPPEAWNVYRYRMEFSKTIHE